ncbi:MAG: NAD-dependent epimerase/dehydratase family protein [Planctomycetota bacterium]
MRVLVTGGAGFLGSHLVERLLHGGSQVVVVDDFSTGRHMNLRRVATHPGLRVEVGSVTAPGRLVRLAGEADALVHLAASVGVQRVLAAPRDALRRNVEGALRVVDAAAATGIRVLFASSSEVYGLVPRLPAHEDDPLLTGFDDAPRWGYARSKVFGEGLLRDLRDAGAADTLSVRLFNTVGPRQVGDHGMVLPRFVDAALADRPLVVHGDGSQRRAFAHVGDVALALARLLALDSFVGNGHHAVNVGGTTETSMLELAQAVLRRTGSRSSVVHAALVDSAGRAVPETPRRVPSLARLEQLVGRPPTRTLDELIDSAVRQRRLEAGHVGVRA